MPPKKPLRSPVCWVRDYQRETHGNAVMHWVAKDTDGGTRNVLVPRHYVSRRSDLRNLLVDHLADLPTDSKTALAAVQAAIERGPKVSGVGTLSVRTGWFPDLNPTAFVMRDRTIGDEATYTSHAWQPHPARHRQRERSRRGVAG